jgi:multidrug resistance efflux pump
LGNPRTISSFLPIFLLTVAACGPSTPEVPFAAVSRETIVSTIQTNGKVTPLEWTAIRAERGGAVQSLLVEKGQNVGKNEAVLQFDAEPAKADLAAAEARILQAEADLETLAEGGRASELTGITNDLESSRLELEAAQKELAGLERLLEKQAATRHEVVQAEERVRKAEASIEALKRKRNAIVSPVDRREAESRLRSAQAEAAAARLRISLSTVRSPMAGVLYNLNVRQGGYLQAGDLVGEVGEVDRVRVVIYVDEPELGRVGPSMPVKVTWDALPGREWMGTVEKTPTQVIGLGNRQVGEVLGILDNYNRELPPGANINAEIESRVAANALTIPKEALRRQGAELGVFLLEGETVEWRLVEIGTASITRAEVLSGLSEGDRVALPSEAELTDGATVKAVLR